MDSQQELIDAAKKEIRALEARAAKLEAEVRELEEELHPFRQDYDNVIQPLVDRLDAVKAAIEELEREVAAADGAAPQADAVPGWTPPPEYVPMWEQYQRAWRSEAADDLPQTKVRPRMDADGDEAKLKQLYRKLARRFHPDLADEDNRERYTHLMSLINEAYGNHDLDALRALDEQPDGASVEAPLSVLTLRQLNRQRAELRDKIDQLRAERNDLLHGELMNLKVQAALARGQGRDLLREMADDLRRDFTEHMAKLDALRLRNNEHAG